MAMSPDASLFSEAMSPASSGFFSLHGDLPPWDTWVAYLNEPLEELRRTWKQTSEPWHWRDCLVTWVPNQVVCLAEAGIAADEIGLAKLFPENVSIEDVLQKMVARLAGRERT